MNVLRRDAEQMRHTLLEKQRLQQSLEAELTRTKELLGLDFRPQLNTTGSLNRTHSPYDKPETTTSILDYGILYFGGIFWLATTEEDEDGKKYPLLFKIHSGTTIVDFRLNYATREDFLPTDGPIVNIKPGEKTEVLVDPDSESPLYYYYITEKEIKNPTRQQLEQQLQIINTFNDALSAWKSSQPK